MLALPTFAVVGVGLTSVDVGTWSHLLEHLLPRYVATTAILVVAVVSLASLFGVGCAWLVSLYDFPARRTFSWAIILPFTVPAYLAAYAYVDVLPVRNLPMAILVLASALAPYTYLACMASLRRQSPHLVDAARTLGLSAPRAFLRLGVALLRPAIAGGALLIALEVLNDFGAVDHFALDTMATGLFRVWFGYGDRGLASQFAFVFLVLVIATVAAERGLRGRARYWPLRATGRVPRRLRLTGWAALAAVSLCSAPVVVGFVGPVAILLWNATKVDLAQELARTMPLIGRSVLLGVVVSALAVGLALVLTVRSSHRPERWFSRLPKVVATLGYAIPGGLIAVGILITVPLTLGMVPLLMYGLVVRFVAIPTQSLAAAQALITPSMTIAARTLGAGPWRAFRKIHLPLLTPSALGAALLVFVDTVKELPVAMILRPLDFELLPIRIHNLASDERLEGAAVGAALLILISIPPLLWLHGGIIREPRRA